MICIRIRSKKRDSNVGFLRHLSILSLFTCLTCDVEGGARPFNFKPPEIVAGTGDKIAIAALRSWATAATTLAKANFEEDRDRDDRNGYEKGCEDRNAHETHEFDRRNHGSGSIGSTGSMGSIASIGSQGRPRECAEAEAS